MCQGPREWGAEPEWGLTLMLYPKPMPLGLRIREEQVL